MKVEALGGTVVRRWMSCGMSDLAGQDVTGPLSPSHATPHLLCAASILGVRLTVQGLAIVISTSDEGFGFARVVAAQYQSLNPVLQTQATTPTDAPSKTSTPAQSKEVPA